MLPLIPAFIQQAYTDGRTHDRLQAFALNLDLSGFTPLTNELMQQGKQGAEKLSSILNEIFEPLVAIIYDSGGFIPYFAGDSFTAIFPLAASERSAQHLLWVASATRERMKERDFDGHAIGIKAGLSFGSVDYGIVGEELKAFYFSGSAITRAAYCQSLAAEHQLLVDDRLIEMLDRSHVATEWVDAQAYRVIDASPGRQADIEPIPLPDVQEEIAGLFLPASVMRNEIAGEFRAVVSVFLAFEGVKDHQQLDDFASRVLTRIQDFGGYFKEIDYGDKGSLMTSFFGAPVSYENNLVRALEYAEAVRVEVENLRQEGANIRYRMGISQGIAYTGVVGGVERCQYACVGQQINLAARLMSNADWGQTLVDGDVARCELFEFQARGTFHYKGFSQELDTFMMMGRRQTGKPVYAGPLIGRDKETEQLVEQISTSLEHQQIGLALVYGEAGIGKSRFTYEVRRVLSKKQNISWFFCPSDQILRKSFNPFIHFLKDYFDQNVDKNSQLNIARFDTVFQQLETRLLEADAPTAPLLLAELRRTRSILAAVVELPVQGSLYDRLDARGRYQNTLAAIINLFAAESLRRPLVIELEDIHWLDDDSRQLTLELMRRLQRLPIFLLCTSRYTDSGDRPSLWKDDQLANLGIEPIVIDLNALSQKAVRQFAEYHLQGPITDTFYDLLLRASNRNPFYLEQLIGYFLENELLIKEDGKWAPRDANIELSDSINSILTARIDRLSNLVRDIVKTAAVIGREFDIPVLRELLKNQDGDDAYNQIQLLEQVKSAEQGQIWSAVSELRYIFRHSLLREAVYSMQLHTRLQELHLRIAEVIERLYAMQIETHYVDLAFHYEQAGQTEKTIEFLRKAADHARANYQNQPALDLYDRLLSKLGKEQSDSAETLKIHLSRGQVLEIIGRWEDALDAYQTAQKLAKQSRDIILLGKCNNHLGHLLLLRGRYEEAMQYLQMAASLYESIDDPLGIAKVNGTLGLLYFRRAQYDRALQYFQKSLETGYTQVGTTASAETVSYLGLTYMNQGEYQEGIDTIKQQIPLHTANEDSMGLANLHTNLGIIYFESGDDRAAQQQFELGLQLAEELGNKQLQAIGLGSLGGVHERLGEYDIAMQLYHRDLELCRELGDWQGIAIAEGLLGELHGTMGNYEQAENRLRHSYTISKDLGYGKGTGKALNALGDIYLYQSRYTESIAHYDQAIELARKTNNVSLLCSSLYEKAQVMLEADISDGRREIIQEALQLAEELNQPDLIFDTQLTAARIQVAEGRVSEGLSAIQDLLGGINLRPEQEAAIYYERYRISKKDTEAHDLARALFEQLYSETPKALYKQRVDELRSS